MDNIVEIILSAVDNASSVFSSVTSSAEEIGTTMETAASEATAGFDEIDSSASEATGSIQDVINYCQGIDGSGPRDAAGGMDELENATNDADVAVEDLGADLGIINAGMLLQTAEQIGQIGSNAEGMAQEMNTAAISVGQLATQTGIAEPQMIALVNTISNATFPNDEAMMYVKSLDQIGVSSENLGASATNLDRINDAFGLGASTVNSLGQELSVLGVDMNHVETSFNALAYANANTVGGMENFYTFLRKYDSQFHELGMTVDQAAVAIAGATHKFGGGRAALSGLNEALEKSNGDLRILEQELGLSAGSLTNASQLTGQYEGQLQQLANEEAEHKTLLDQLGAAWEDFSLALSGVLSPLGSAIGLIGQAGSFAMQINGLVTLGSSLKGVVGTLREFNAVQAITNAIEGEGAVARVASAIGITTEAAAAEGATVAFGGLAIAEGAALWPILAIIAAIALLVVAVYEIGKAFGWWSDVGTMFEAIQAGVMRLWSAFVNHPDVQAAISAISNALQVLWGAIQTAGQAILEFFGISTGGEFDVVRALIDGIGAAWEAVTHHIRFAIEIVMAIVEAISSAGDAFGSFYEDTLAPFGEWLSGVFAPVWQLIGDLINAISPFVSNLTNAFTLFANGQMSLPSLVWTVLTTLLNAYVTIFSLIMSRVTAWGISLLAKGVSVASNFVNNIVNWLRQLPGRALSALLQVVSSIVSAGAQWVSNATAQASSVVSGVVGRLSSLPGQISSALGGVVDAIVSPFRSAYDAVCGVVDSIKSKVQEGLDAIGSLGSGYGSDHTEAGGDHFSAYGNDILPNATEYSVGSGSVEVSGEVTERLILDFQNVPGHIDTAELIEVMKDRRVLETIARSADFQSIDTKVKNEIIGKSKRYYGV